MPTAKKAASKNNPKDILCNENHVILVHLASNIVLKTRKHFQAAGYQFFLKMQTLEICLPHLLTDHRIETK